MNGYVGGLAVGFVVLELVRAWLAGRMALADTEQAWRPNALTAAPFGLAGGISTMIAHAAGAITTIYLLPQRLDKRTFVGTCGRFYFVVNTLKVPLLVNAEYITSESLIKSLWLVPLAPLSVWVGTILNRRLSPGSFNKVIYVLLAVSGSYLLYSNAFWP